MTKVLDHGYVELRWVGAPDPADLAPVNFARASKGKASTAFRDVDARLLRRLAAGEHLHASPFYACAFWFEVKAPLMVARQWWKHVVASRAVDDPFAAWNERTLRDACRQPDLYVPGDRSTPWRLAPPAGEKQGSGGPAPAEVASLATANLLHAHDVAVATYERLLGLGVAPEQARAALPGFALYTTWSWYASLEAVRHFVALRDHPDAQVEVQLYARAIDAQVAEALPHSWAALRGREQLVRDRGVEGMAARVLHLLDQHGLWSEHDQTYTFPDGDTWERPRE